MEGHEISKQIARILRTHPGLEKLMKHMRAALLTSYAAYMLATSVILRLFFMIMTPNELDNQSQTNTSAAPCAFSQLVQHTHSETHGRPHHTADLEMLKECADI